MKFNKFVCSFCGHEFYDSKAASTCDACGRFVNILRQGTITINNQDVRILERTDGSHIREAIRKDFEDSTTRKKT